MLTRSGWLLTLGLVCAVLVRTHAAQPPTGRAAAAPAGPDAAKEPNAKEPKEPKEKVEGIPIQSDLVLAKCGSCHKADDQKRMTRISYRRASPENWERTIKRMVSLNHAPLDPPDARAILKYLADHQGLAPEEARPIAFEAERRTIDYNPDIEKDVSDTC